MTLNIGPLLASPARPSVGWGLAPAGPLLFAIAIGLRRPPGGLRSESCVAHLCLKQSWDGQVSVKWAIAPRAPGFLDTLLQLFLQVGLLAVVRAKKRHNLGVTKLPELKLHSAFPYDAWRAQGRTNNLWQVPEEEGNERGTQAGVRKMGDYVLFAQTFGHLVASAFPLDVSCSRAVGTESPSTTNSCFAFSGDGQEAPPFKGCPGART